MTDIERLAIEQAIYNAIGADLKTGVPGNLRGEVNAHYLDLYEQTGATGFEVRVGGQKVGTFGFAKVKGEPEKRHAELSVTDMAALREWRDGEYGGDFDHWCDLWIDDHLQEMAIEYAQETGEMPDGVTMVEVVEPAKPDGIRPGGTLRIKPAFVAQARAALEGGPIAGLLGGDAS